jgi:predicted Zn-dependent protease
MKCRRSTAILTVVLLIFSTACAVNPVTGKKELSLISEAQEIELGRQTDQEIRAQYGIYNDPALTEYVRGIGVAMGPLTHRPDLTYHFAILDTPVINAFAAPGGYIYVTRGILSLFNSEAELAVVVAHELGHVNARHSVRKMSQLMLIQLGLAVGSALSETVAKISGVASIGIQLLFLKFSRDDEFQADQLGVDYSRKSGYNPGKMVDFFASLQKMGDLSGGQSLPGFLSTHPLTSNRIKKVQEMQLAADSQLKVSRTSYLNKINNLIYGNDPQQGFVQGSAFYHPGMRFAFNIPSGWTVQNTPSQVVLVAPDENAALILKAEKSAMSLRDYAAQKAQGTEGYSLLDERNLSINGLSSYQQLYDVAQENQQGLRMRASYIRKGQHIYSLSALSTQEAFNNYDFQFGTVVGSFKQLNDRRYINVQPTRIRVIRADGRQNLRTIFQKAGINEKSWPQFAIMNALDLNETPQAGRLIKTVK